MEQLIAGLRHFRTNILWQKKELFAEAAYSQRPFAMLIACSDSRVLPETLLQLAPGDLFVSRNAGNIVPLPEFGGGEAASIEYAVQGLGVTDLIVCGHYRCGAVHTLLEGAEKRPMPLVDGWLEHASETRTLMRVRYAGLTGDQKWDKAVEQNVLIQLRHLAQHPSVAAGLASGTVRLHAWVLRFETYEIFSHAEELDAFVPLLETPVIRGVSPVAGSRRAASRRPSSFFRSVRSGVNEAFTFRESSGLTAACLGSLLALGAFEFATDNSAMRIDGRPFSPNCTVSGCVAITDHSEDKTALGDGAHPHERNHARK